MYFRRWQSLSNGEKLSATLLLTVTSLVCAIWLTALNMAASSKRLSGDSPGGAVTPQRKAAVVVPAVVPRACAAALRPNGKKDTDTNIRNDPMDDVRVLAARGLAIPVVGMEKRSLYDSFADGRGKRKHEAIDIHAPRGTPVVAADDGCVVKLFRSIPGGITLYQFDPEGNFAYYYAHLDRYAEELKEGTLLKRGDVLGYVGTTGNATANAPHLHFAIFRLGPERRWWIGEPVNPYSVFTYP